MCYCDNPDAECKARGHQSHRLYSTKQTPRGSVVVLGDRIVSEYEMPAPHAQELADWLNHQKGRFNAAEYPTS